MVAGTVYEPKVDASRWRVYGAVGPKKAPKEETARNKKTRYYPADDVKRPLPSRRHLHKPARVRPSITEGTILILLAGRFRGKRVICLKPLKSGLLLVTGPFKVNGVPVRRVSQAYVIATSTKLDISSVDTSRFTDEYFTESKVKGMKKEGEEEFFLGDAPKAAIVSDVRKADQKAIDDGVLAVVAKTPNMKRYLKAAFTLRGEDKPHKMIF